MNAAIGYIEQITEMLRRFEKTRDNDVTLLAYILYNPPFNLDLKQITAHELLRKMADGDLVHFETIRRTRQRVQQEHPELRGRRSEERRQLSRNVRSEIAQRTAAKELDRYVDEMVNEQIQNTIMQGVHLDKANEEVDPEQAAPAAGVDPRE